MYVYYVYIYICIYIYIYIYLYIYLAGLRELQLRQDLGLGPLGPLFSGRIAYAIL